MRAELVMTVVADTAPLGIALREFRSAAEVLPEDLSRQLRGFVLDLFSSLVDRDCLRLKETEVVAAGSTSQVAVGFGDAVEFFTSARGALQRNFLGDLSHGASPVGTSDSGESKNTGDAPDGGR